MILASRQGPRWVSPHQLPVDNPWLASWCWTEFPPLPGPEAEASFLAHLCWKTPHGERPPNVDSLAVGRILSLCSHTALLEERQDFRGLVFTTEP